MAKTTEHRSLRPSRRSILKGAAARSRASRLAPRLLAGERWISDRRWAQDTKDIVINQWSSGMSYSTIIQIAEQATVDLPFSVEMSVTDAAQAAPGEHAGSRPRMLNRLTTQSDSIDVARDIELWMRVITVPARGAGRSIRRLLRRTRQDRPCRPASPTHWDKATTIYRDGQLEGGFPLGSGRFGFAEADLAPGAGRIAKPRPGVARGDVLHRCRRTGDRRRQHRLRDIDDPTGVFNADTLGHSARGQADRPPDQQLATPSSSTTSSMAVPPAWISRPS